MGKLKNYDHMQGNRNPKYKTGLAVCGHRKSLYNSWQGMKQRCLNPNNPKYYRYGGRGITICDEWLDIIGFAKWALTAGWEEGLTIDRIDNNGNYEPGNCRWITREINSERKRRMPISVEHDVVLALKNGSTYQKAADKFNISKSTVYLYKRKHEPKFYTDFFDDGNA